MSHARISRPPSYFTRRRSAWFPSFFFFYSPHFLVLLRKHALQFFRAEQSFFPYSNTFFRLRDIDSPLLNSIRHDTWLFLEAFRHRDRLDECGRVGTAIVQKSCYSGSNAICVCVPLYARRTSLVPDGKNTVAHDTSLDRYPVWRIRSFIGIDIFAVAWSVYFSRTHFYLLDIIMRFTVLRYSWHSLEFNTFQLLKKYSSQLIPRSKKVLMLNLQN